MSDICTVFSRLNGADLEFVDKASGTVVFAFRNAIGSNFVQSAVDGLTATGSNRGGALAITAQIVRFTTVGSNTGCVLPVSTAGYDLAIINAGLNPLTIYAQGSDTIDGTAGSTGVSLTNGKTVAISCASPGAWHQLKSA
jgi:hypothetical protein